MNNKKLLKFVLKDLSELEELLTEKGNNNFDELELEFLQTRVSGAKRMISILFDRENTPDTEIKKPLVEVVSEKREIEPDQTEKLEETIVAKEEVKEKIKVEVQQKEENKIIQKENITVEEKIEEPIEVSKEKLEIKTERIEKKEVKLEEEETVDEVKQTLGDSFHKEKSVNDLIDVDKTNLEQKLSNRPVKNIKSSIGINDRFQFIRELFDGNADTFSKAVSELDSKNDIKEAVEYLQQNFKWKKNETSLKFVSLVKRRFINE